VILHIQSGDSLTLLNTAAPDATLKQLVIALIAGSLLIFPALFFLLRTFKREQF
jgi:cytochrome d ubiquinol oxidase subunit II